MGRPFPAYDEEPEEKANEAVSLDACQPEEKVSQPFSLEVCQSKKARAKAMRLLEHMPRSEKQLYEKLNAAGFTEEAIADAMAYVKSFGYVDDLRYAEQYLMSRMQVKSRQQLLMELARKGIDRHVAELAWEETVSLTEPDEHAMIREAILKKVDSGSRIDEKTLRRLYGYFARRGFRTGDVSAVLNELDISAIYDKNHAFDTE
jgi:regulatory protein